MDLVHRNAEILCQAELDELDCKLVHAGVVLVALMELRQQVHGIGGFIWILHNHLGQEISQI